MCFQNVLSESEKSFRKVKVKQKQFYWVSGFPPTLYFLCIRALPRSQGLKNMLSACIPYEYDYPFGREFSENFASRTALLSTGATGHLKFM